MSASTMPDAAIFLTMSRTLDRDQIDFRVMFGDSTSHTGNPSGAELAAIQLNRRICLSDGQIHPIAHYGGLFSIDSVLRPATASSARHAFTKSGAELPLAIFHHERTGLFRHRNLLIAESIPSRRFLLRRRSWFGSPANADLLDITGDVLPADAPLLLRAEKAGTWRQRLSARWMGPSVLPVPIMLFALNVLADLDRRAAVALSAGAAGL